MLTIATYVLLGVITVIHGFIVYDVKKHHEPQPIESASPQTECGDTHEKDDRDLKDFI